MTAVENNVIINAESVGEEKMTIKEIKTLIDTTPYDFLRTDARLSKDRMLLLTVAGSHAYGTNTPTSDVDIRGIVITPPECLFGLASFEQFENKTTDTVIYELKRMVHLLMGCNPNCIELLGNIPENYLFLSEEGKMLLENRHLFLSQKAIQTFGGYATAQLRRVQNAVARDSLTQGDKEVHIYNSIKNAMYDLKTKYAEIPEGSLNVYVDDAVNPEYEKEIFIDTNLVHYPLRDYKNLWSDMHNIAKSYGHLNTRNSKKDDLHLNKHIMHLFRLYLMAIDILEKEEIVTYRSDDRDFLMQVRNGYFMNSDGTVRNELYELLNEYEKRFQQAVKNTKLPQVPDYSAVGKLVETIIKKRLEKML